MADKDVSRSEEARRAARNAASRERRRRERALRRGRRNWRVFIAVYSLIFLLAGASGCWVLFRYAASYEASIPEHVMDDFMASTGEDRWYEIIRGDVALPESEFEDTGAIFEAYYDAAVRGRKLSYRKKPDEYTASSPVYTVRGGGMDLAVVRLVPEGRGAAGFGFELWRVGEVRGVLALDHLESVTVEIDAPRGDTVYLNGRAVGERWLTGEAAPAPDLTELESRFSEVPSFARYRIPMYGEITVTDEKGAALSPQRSEDGRTVRYVAREDEFYSFTVRAPEPVTVSVSGARLDASEAVRSESGVLAGLEAYTGENAYRTLTWTCGGLYTRPEISAEMNGTALTPLINEKGELIFFPAQDDALAAEMRPTVEDFFSSYIDYSGKAYNAVRHHNLLSRILPGSELYAYVRDSRDAMIWASATQVHYDELTFSDFYRVSDSCFTCTIRYKADFAAQSWYESYTYDLQNAYEMAFVRSGNRWLAAAMSVAAG